MNRKTVLTKTILTVQILLFVLIGQAQVPFTPGNIVVYRIGDGSGGLPNAGMQITLIANKNEQVVKTILCQ